MTDKIVTPADVAAFKTRMTEAIDVWANSLPTAPGGGTTDPPAADYTPKLTVDVTTKPGSALLTWTDGPSGAPLHYKYGRNGVDTAGNGPWSSPLAMTHTAELDKLIPGVQYTFTVTAMTDNPAHSWIKAVVAQIPISGGGGVDPQHPGTGAVTWNSGVWCNQDASQATTFERQRGQKLGNIQVATSRESWDAQLNPWWKEALPAGFTGTLVIKIPLWTEDGDRGTDQDWRTIAAQAAAVDPAAWVCIGWEMNLPSWYYHITQTNYTDWLKSYRRAVDLMRGVAPRLRFAWNPNGGSDQTGVDQRKAFQAVKDLHTGYGPDSYDCYPPDISAAAWQKHLTGYGLLGESYAYARSQGMQFVLPEWGVASGTQWGFNKGFDNPKYINDYMGFLKSKQHETVTLANGGAVVPSIGFETYFSEPDGYLRSQLWTQNPKAGAAYTAQFATRP